MIVGMDFGTTNSGMAVYDGRRVDLLPLDPSNSNPAVARTSLYITKNLEMYIGRQAIDLHFEQNLNRPTKLEKVWVGEIEMTFGEIGTWVEDVYMWQDVLAPGRLLLSIKSALSLADYTGTVVERLFFPIEDLVATYLYLTRLRAERHLGRELDTVVLGRPVRFADDPTRDAIAQERLINAAFRAGYQTVYLEYEPIAAAYYYEQSIRERQNVLVFDFGGGTLDMTVIVLGDPARRAVLATGGIPIAGDVFDQKIVRARFPWHFGEGSSYRAGNKLLSLANWIFDSFSSWQTISDLSTPANLAMLRDVARTSTDPDKIAALISLVSNNYSLSLYDIAERAKRQLSDERLATMELSGPQIAIRDTLSRTAFEAIINAEIEAIAHRLDETLRGSGLRAAQIDAVITTGGSSQIPAFQRMLTSRFGPAKVHSTNVFSGVAAGLGIIAHEIEQGRVASKAYSRAEYEHPTQAVTRPGTPTVDLALIKRRLAVQEAQGEGVADSAHLSLLWLTREGDIHSHTLPKEQLAKNNPLPLDPPPPADAHALVLAAPDEPLLLVTSHYRFLSLSPRRIHLLAEQGVSLRALPAFEPREHLCAMSRWSDIAPHKKLVLVTSRGFARAFDLDPIRASVTENSDLFRLDKVLPGLPVALVGADPHGDILAVASDRRATRVSVQALPTRGAQLIRDAREGRVVGAVAAHDPQRPLLLLNAQGQGKRLLPSWLPPSAKPNPPARVVVSGAAPIALAHAGGAGAPWLATSRRLIPLQPDALPLDEGARKAQRLARLLPDEQPVGLLHVGDDG